MSWTNCGTTGKRLDQRMWNGLLLCVSSILMFMAPIILCFQRAWLKATTALSVP